jgi:hypothetical protein
MTGNTKPAYKKASFSCHFKNKKALKPLRNMGSKRKYLKWKG